MDRLQNPTLSLNTPSMRQFVTRYGVYVSLGVVLAASALITPDLYSQQTLFVVLRQASQLGIVAIGQTLVLLVAGIDLSVGGVIVLTSVIIAQVTRGQDAMLLPAMAIALTLGGLVGLFNGLLVTKRNVPPFVATLGVLVLVQGAILAYTRGIPSGQVPPGLGIVNQALGPLPIPVVIWIVMMLVTGFFLYLRPYGRRLYATGMNREAARLSGLRVDVVVISAYVLCSLLCVVGGIVLSGYIGYVDRYLGRGMDLDSIAAAVVGGTAFTGGRGNLLGTAAGVLIVQLLSSMTVLLGLSVQAQLVVKGLVIIGAVALYSLAARRGE